MQQLPEKRQELKFPNLVEWKGSISQTQYAMAGTTLLATKFALDWSVAHFIFHRKWEIWSYLLPGQSLDFLRMAGDDRTFFAVILVLALPFIWMGMVLTIRRLRSVGLPIFWAQLFFVPFLNLIFFLMLCLLPEKRNVPDDPSTSGAGLAPPLQESRAGLKSAKAIPPALAANRADGLFAIVSTVPGALLMTWLSTIFFQSYGWGLFVGVPFLVGMSSAYLYGRNEPKSLGQCGAVAMVAMTMLGLGIFLIAWEGAICLLMAAPIGYFLAAMGALLGYGLQKREPLRIEQVQVLLPIFLSMPLLMGAEQMSHPKPPIIGLTSCVTVAASPERVWENVIAFPQLPPPDEAIFKLGVGHPVGATIHGAGPGAVRKCRFSTGAFIEPIQVWQAPHLLRFGVSAQPPSMRELSWMHEIHPAHLHGYLDVRGGQFKLIPINTPAGVHTRIEGTTWYANQMWPASYWRMWSDEIIHTIHMRVLRHIKQQSEQRKQIG